MRTLPTGIAVHLFHVLGTVRQRLGRPSEISAATALQLNRPGGYSIEKARSLLGEEPIVVFEKGIRRSEAAPAA